MIASGRAEEATRTVAALRSTDTGKTMKRKQRFRPTQTSVLHVFVFLSVTLLRSASLYRTTNSEKNKSNRCNNRISPPARLLIPFVSQTPSAQVTYAVPHCHMSVICEYRSFPCPEANGRWKPSKHILICLRAHRVALNGNPHFNYSYCRLSLGNRITIEFCVAHRSGAEVHRLKSRRTKNAMKYDATQVRREQVFRTNDCSD